jgi:hypothetical protein
MNRVTKGETLLDEDAATQIRSLSFVHPVCPDTVIRTTKCDIT